MSTLVECVPNFSEGRDKAKVDAIVDAMKMPGVYLLDREMDSDHNRCVITLVGEREPIQEAAIRGVGKAAELIDLTSHTGAHPRMGAADVIPFIPIDGVTIEDCVAMANHVGEEIWKRYKIPVYLYESAARTEGQRRCGNVTLAFPEGQRMRGNVCVATVQKVIDCPPDYNAKPITLTVSNSVTRGLFSQRPGGISPVVRPDKSLLPPGILVSGERHTSGVTGYFLSGKPTVVGTYKFAFFIQDANGCSYFLTYTVIVVNGT